MHKRLRILAITIGWCLCALLPARAADDNAAKEYVVKAVYLYKFTKYVDWPGAKSPLLAHAVNICIAGDDPFGSALDIIRNASSAQMNFNVIRDISDSQVPQCHILFVSNSAEDRIPSILAQAKAYSVLTVSEAHGFADEAGIIEMVKVQKSIGLFSKDKINLRINLRMATQEGLRIDAQLLEIAAEVIR